MKKRYLKLLYLSIDGKLSKKEKQQLDIALNKSPELQKEKEEILRQRILVSKSKVTMFKPDFADRVMKKIKKVEIKPAGNDIFYHTLKYVFRRVALVGVALCLVIISYNIVRTGNFSLEGALGITPLTVEENMEIYSTLILE
jgi:hypothetical protein